ncbi:MAG: hypothetical protein ACE5FN_07165 [Leptospirillia bacterium]
MTPRAVNLTRTAAIFAAVVALCAIIGPAYARHKEWLHAGPVIMTVMFVFWAYAIGYLALGILYMVRKRAYDRHIFPEGLRLEGAAAVKLGGKYLILSSISAFGATLLLAVILRGLRHAHLLS